MQTVAEHTLKRLEMHQTAIRDIECIIMDIIMNILNLISLDCVVMMPFFFSSTMQAFLKGINSHFFVCGTLSLDCSGQLSKEVQSYAYKHA